MSIERKKDPHPKNIHYLKLVAGQAENVPDEETAREVLGFGSAKALYRYLSSPPSFPICPECGESPVEPNHCKPPRKRQPATGSGDTVPLPPASRATPVLKAALKKAAADLTHLERRRERLENERFVVRQEWVLGYEVPQEKTTLARVYTDQEGNERWELEEAAVAPGEASPVPPEPLTSLVAIYTLTGAPIEELLDKLHPDPEAVNGERLVRAVEELKRDAGELSTLVRGGKVRRGPRTEGLGAIEHAVALYGRKRSREGKSYAEILKELDDGALWRLPEGLTRSRLKRLVESNERSWRMN